ncbi:MAG: uracil-DNA glycosylase [Oscillospiraceae bacterium]|nr:uracil-DNA glycosylase [Oscillospiraceae bacterium]
MKTWEELEKSCLNCTDCLLSETRTNVVFGSGDRNAKLMFIGEGPGEQEDLRGLPFVGRAGQLLDEMLAAIGMSREQVYIANIVKCRPPNNRDPLNLEQDACIGYLREQVRLIKPKIIACLGRVAAMKIIRADYKITQEHGLFEKRGDILLTATYHPAYILRDPRKKPDTFMDMCAIEDQLSLL